jgi:Ribbon-helix-helix protein, copG family
MSDVLIRDVPDEVLAGLDAHAARLGLSRVEYIRRRLAQDASAIGVPVSVADLRGFAAAFADLSDPSIIGGAWD